MSIPIRVTVVTLRSLLVPGACATGLRDRPTSGAEITVCGHHRCPIDVALGAETTVCGHHRWPIDDSAANSPSMPSMDPTRQRRSGNVVPATENQAFHRALTDGYPTVFFGFFRGVNGPT